MENLALLAFVASLVAPVSLVAWDRRVRAARIRQVARFVALLGDSSFNQEEFAKITSAVREFVPLALALVIFGVVSTPGFYFGLFPVRGQPLENTNVFVLSAIFAAAVVYEHLYARSLKMARSDQGKFETDVAGKIGEWLNLGDAKVTVAVRDESVISFDAKNGVEPPAFAYRSAQFQQSGGKLTVNAHVVMAGPEGESREPYVPHPGDPMEVETK